MQTGVPSANGAVSISVDWPKVINDIERRRTLTYDVVPVVAMQLGTSASFPEDVYSGDVQKFTDFCVSRGLDFVLRTVSNDEKPYTDGGFYFSHVFKGKPVVAGVYSYGSTLGRAMLASLLRYSLGQSREVTNYDY